MIQQDLEQAHLTSLIEPDAPPPLWLPDPRNKPQQLAYSSRAMVLGYGGAAGGGKTDLILGKALTRHQRSVVFRKAGEDLGDAMTRAEQILGLRGTLNRSQGVARADDRTIDFAGLLYARNVASQQGRARDLMAFDEATQIPESDYRFVKTWCRTTTPGQATQVVLAFNPPMYPEEEWVIDYFRPWLDPDKGDRATPGDLVWFARIDDRDEIVDGPDPVQFRGETYHPESRTFIPARVEDNPHLMGSDYVRQLDALPTKELRDALRKGIITRNLRDQPLQLIPTSWVIAAQERWEQLHVAAADAGETILEHIGVPLTQTGADASRGGKDQTVIVNRYGTYFDTPVEHQGVSTSDGKKVAALILEENDGVAPIAVDAIGIGSSPFDVLTENHSTVIGLSSAERSGTTDHRGRRTPATDRSGKYRLGNRRAEMWWRFMEALDPENGQDLALPPGSEVRRQLTAPQYRLTVGGVLIEKKEEIRKRLGRSPDLEAIVYAFYEPAQAEVPRAGAWGR